MCRSKFSLRCSFYQVRATSVSSFKWGENPLCALVAPAKSFLQSDLVPLVQGTLSFPSGTSHHRTLVPLRASTQCLAPQQLELHESRIHNCPLHHSTPCEEELGKCLLQEGVCGLTRVSATAGPTSCPSAPELGRLDTTDQTTPSRPASAGQASTRPILGLSGAEGETLKSSMEQPRAHGDGEDGVA